MLKAPKFLPTRSRLTSLVGLSLDGSKLEGVVLRRTNGSLASLGHFSVSLSLDPLTADPALVGREIRNHLDAAEIRERSCIFGLPLKWALTAHVEIPELPASDVSSFLALEAEHGFPCDVQTLQVATSLFRIPSGKQHALLIGFPKNHLTRIEQCLRAAKLNPISFTIGISALQPIGDADGLVRVGLLPESRTATSARTSAVGDDVRSPSSDIRSADGLVRAGVLALAIGENSVALQATSGGGIASLRVLEGVLENEGSRPALRSDAIAREVRITLGQMPADLRDSFRSVRVFGSNGLARELADHLELRFESAGLNVEAVTNYSPNELGVLVPAQTQVSVPFSLAARRLAGRPIPFEFLPPKVSTWQQLSTRYSSGKFRGAITAGAAVVAIVGGLFLYQQIRLWRVESQAKVIRDKVAQVEQVQDKIRQYRPWFDETVRGLTILRTLTQAFPEDGAVTAKTVEIRDLNTVVCTGTARDSRSLLQTVEKLRGMPNIHDVNLGPSRGQAPAIQFSFNFAVSEGGSSAN